MGGIFSSDSQWIAQTALLNVFGMMGSRKLSRNWSGTLPKITPCIESTCLHPPSCRDSWPAKKAKKNIHARQLLLTALVYAVGVTAALVLLGSLWPKQQGEFSTKAALEHLGVGSHSDSNIDPLRMLALSPIQPHVSLNHLDHPPDIGPITTKNATGNIHYLQSIAELEKCLESESVAPGDVLVLSCGTFQENFVVNFTKSGLPGTPVVLRPAKRHCVTFNGSATFHVNGSYVEIWSFIWMGPKISASTAAPVHFSIGTQGNALIDCQFDAYYPVAVRPGMREKQTLVELWGFNHRVEWNSITRMQHVGELVRVMGSIQNTTTPSSAGHLIAYNYFGPREDLGHSNGGEIIQIGLLWPRANTNTAVLWNVFDGISSDHEALSLKGSGNEIRYNTFVNGSGLLTIRHGNQNIIAENYFFCRKSDVFCGGVRIHGHENIVEDNYFEGGYSSGRNDRVDGSIVLHGGATIANERAGRWAARGTIIQRNLLVGCHWCLSIGALATYGDSADFQPLNNTVSHNIFLGSNTGSTAWSSSDAKSQFTIRDDCYLVKQYGQSHSTKFESNIFVNGFLPDALEHFRNASTPELELNQHGLLVPVQSSTQDLPRLKYRPLWRADVGHGHEIQ